MASAQKTRLVLVALAGALVTVSAPANAQPAGQPMPPMDFINPPVVTAQMIVDAFRPPVGTQLQCADRSQGIGYLRATKDLLSRRRCVHQDIPEVEVYGEIVGYLAKLPPEIRRKPAAPLIAEALDSIPCPQPKER